MNPELQQPDGDEWQTFVLQLLYLRYGSDLVEVPDDHGGDFGIEAFATTDGCAFQCYSPEGLSNVPETAAKHKRKVARDIKKFDKNRSDLAKVFGATKIRRWLLVVPDHCSADTGTHSGIGSRFAELSRPQKIEGYRF